jgi:hypothetical protein
VISSFQVFRPKFCLHFLSLSVYGCRGTLRTRCRKCGGT